jgi:hypothetical protein
MTCARTADRTTRPLRLASRRPRHIPDTCVTITGRSGGQALTIPSGVPCDIDDSAVLLDAGSGALADETLRDPQRPRPMSIERSVFRTFRSHGGSATRPRSPLVGPSTTTSSAWTSRSMRSRRRAASGWAAKKSARCCCASFRPTSLLVPFASAPSMRVTSGVRRSSTGRQLGSGPFSSPMGTIGPSSRRQCHAARPPITPGCIG